MEGWRGCEWFYVFVCFDLYCEDKTPEQRFESLLYREELWTSYSFFGGLPPDGFDVSLFGFGEGNYLWHGLVED